MSDAAINTAWDRIEAFMRDAGQRRKYELREKYEHDYVSDMEGSWKRGRLEGVKQGRSEGRAEGRQLGIAQIAMNFLRAGTPVATVAQMAELPEAVIRKMAEEHTVPKDVDTEQEGMGKNRENTVQMKILSGTKKTFS